MEITYGFHMTGRSIEGAYHVCRSALNRNIRSPSRTLLYIWVEEERPPEYLEVKARGHKGFSMENLGQGEFRIIRMWFKEDTDGAHVQIKITPFDEMSGEEYEMARNFWVDFIPLYAERTGIELSAEDLKRLYPETTITVREAYLKRVLRVYVYIGLIAWCSVLLASYASDYFFGNPFYLQTPFFGLMVFLTVYPDYLLRRRFINTIKAKINKADNYTNTQC
jgi:hypothetical protein